MEAKLAEYRAKKEKQQISRCSNIYNWLFGDRNNANKSEDKRESFSSTPAQESPCRKRPELVSEVTTSSYQEHIDGLSEKNWRDYIPLGLKVLLWLCLWKFFIEVGFGAVYFVVSCSYLMYKNTRTEPRQRGQLSAYSVFNPNQERLDGTFTAEQFEKELRLGAGSVR
ncbi:SAYSvFN domain-containing protein 1-like [Mercenaria mercenaria]|uniref:SAYSvFN domain-containing protein 1-like n=1 Tax=Mercenaria mercenaria TaxID=6596 RepID=UPI00234E76A9|nr:SAYSvFN domain-containing protein 1-like [Mercenaria mercenaria]